MKIDALLADKQPLTAAGLESFLLDKQEIKIVGKVAHGEQLVIMMEKTHPDLLIVDYNIPGYVTLDDIRNAMSVSSRTNVLILSADNNKATILDALQLGVKGYITKDCSLQEVGMAVQSTAKGEKFFCHKILDIIMEKRFGVEPEMETSGLTTRETEILKLIAHGHSSLAIAEKLFLSPHTVQTHRKSIIRKLNIKSPTEFVIYAMDFGLLKIK
ncbi:response regulator transcription factor [Chryseolinea sp. H1M3-3]|uniref:LuxR C-terminal-related transcriptional regulator n=1 Tax=Chryseolinea sp. H1M3-3 TaxID=3034144 RepID=UPI0023ED3D9A|nr:response regulator transcription factor [Chryseolinea sp. H1M3-3]